MTGKSNVVAEKSLDFAVRVVNMYRILKNRHRETVISKQVLRAGTSIGANVREALSAQSTADFLAKLSIALKECSETDYWLELLHRTNLLTQAEYDSISMDCQELFALLTSIIKTTKRNNSNEHQQF